MREKSTKIDWKRGKNRLTLTKLDWKWSWRFRPEGGAKQHLTSAAVAQTFAPLVWEAPRTRTKHHWAHARGYCKLQEGQGRQRATERLTVRPNSWRKKFENKNSLYLGGRFGFIYFFLCVRGWGMGGCVRGGGRGGSGLNANWRETRVIPGGGVRGGRGWRDIWGGGGLIFSFRAEVVLGTSASAMKMVFFSEFFVCNAIWTNGRDGRCSASLKTSTYRQETTMSTGKDMRVLSFWGLNYEFNKVGVFSMGVLLPHVGPAWTSQHSELYEDHFKDDLQNNFKDDLENNFKDNLAFSKSLEIFPFNKEDVGNHVAFEWAPICYSVLILVPPC